MKSAKATLFSEPSKELFIQIAASASTRRHGLSLRMIDDAGEVPASPRRACAGRRSGARPLAYPAEVAEVKRLVATGFVESAAIVKVSMGAAAAGPSRENVARCLRRAFEKDGAIEYRRARPMGRSSRSRRPTHGVRETENPLHRHAL